MLEHENKHTLQKITTENHTHRHLLFRTMNSTPHIFIYYSAQ